MKKILFVATAVALVSPTLSMAHVSQQENISYSFMPSPKVISIELPKDMLKGELGNLKNFNTASTLDASIQYECVCGGGGGGAISSSGGMGMGAGSLGAGGMGMGSMGMGGDGGGGMGGGSSVANKVANAIGKVAGAAAGAVIGGALGGNAGAGAGGLVGSEIGGVFVEEMVKRGAQEEGKPFAAKGSKFH